MQRIVILGGGVGGTLTANLLASKLSQPDRPGRGEGHRRRRHRPARLPARLHVHRDGRRAGREAPAAGAVAPRPARRPRRRQGRPDRRGTPAAVELASGEQVHYDQLVLATGSRIVPETIEHFEQEAHHFYTAEAAREAAPGARRVHRRQDRHRHRRHALQVPAGAARGRLPHRGRAARARPARQDARSTSARRSAAPSRSSPSARWRRPILEEKGIELHIFFNVESIDPQRKVVLTLRARSYRYDLLILVPAPQGRPGPHRLAASPRPRPAGCRPTATRSRSRPARTGRTPTPRRYPNIYALGDATDLPLSKAGSTAHFEAPVVAERIAAAVEGREPAGKHADLHGQGHVLLRGRRREGHAPPVRLRPPAQAAQAEPALAPGQDRLQQDLLAHRPEGPRLSDGRAARDRPGRSACARRTAPARSRRVRPSRPRRPDACAAGTRAGIAPGSHARGSARVARTRVPARR